MKDTLSALASSCSQAKTIYPNLEADLYIIDNANNEKYLAELENIKSILSEHFSSITIFTGHGNIGYGRGNNLAIDKTGSDFHLILNPDAVMHKEAIGKALDYLVQNANVALVAPQAYNEDGSIQYIAKRYPTLLTLALRFFKFPLARKVFQHKLDLYEYRDQIPSKEPIEIDIASGCFMFCNTKLLKDVGGFSNDYFMYFEDFDLSVKLNQKYSLAYLPTVEIKHYGGNTSSKGLRHIWYFLHSGLKFFNNNGWR